MIWKIDRANPHLRSTQHHCMKKGEQNDKINSAILVSFSDSGIFFVYIRKSGKLIMLLYPFPSTGADYI